ncbi:helix-turn-helix transcriptional regulator [Kineococcus rhizosphaerae]|uniref:Putative DNA-binding transcriptional regulator YafY n=1 Tax=Kineococcus rhizosphaerae TaxID=559628 RepID=A0A2T0RAH3_9ACTN|nr:YafY family protein [Kineococcus rhizosphaerae]PRY18166.1 putative DNA-binding transcriptional regulator YafY [Kineococcus rhizosphaerae]
MSAEGTTERVLRLLGLLQHRPRWTAADLAAELGVTDRCVRRDVARLRTLGYPVHAVPGAGGGYQLGAGTRLPPLLLDEEETVATAVALRLAAGAGIAGAGDAALRALTKLDQVMPPALRHRVRAVHDATDTLHAPGRTTEVDPELLATLARACRDTVRVRFTHSRTPDGPRTERTVEPLRLVTTGQRWYLVAYDLDRADWRTFRLDRVQDTDVTTWRFHPRDHPDPVTLVQDALTVTPYRLSARIRVHAPVEQVRDLVPETVGRVEPDGPEHCLLLVAADDPAWIVAHTARLGLPAEFLEPAELRAAAARTLAHLTVTDQHP